VDRRDFLKYGTTLGALLPGSPVVAAAWQQERPPSGSTSAPRIARGDLAVVNAKVMTVEPSQPAAQAILVRGGRITHVGTSSEVKAKAGDARLFDAGGRTVVPGFIDAHTHMEVALSHQMYAADVHTPPLKNIREVQAVLQTKAAQTPKGQWVIGRAGFGLENGLEEKRLPTRQDLDEVSQDHPIIIFSGRHISMLNSRALHEIGMWDAGTAKPPTGTTIHRDASGVPTGLASEVFYFLPEFSVEQMKTAMRGRAKEQFTDKGTTTIYTIPFSANDVRADLELQRAGELPLRIRMFYHVPHMTSLEGLLNMGYPSGTGDDMFRFGGMKIFVDGTGGDAMGHRYDDLKWTQTELNHLLSSADAAGIQTILHLVTDGGLRMATAAIEETRRSNPKKPYLMHRIEHGGDRGGIDAIRHLRDMGIRISLTPGRGRPNATRPRYKTLVQENFDPILITDTTGTTPGSADILFKIACVAVSVQDGGGAPKGEELGFEGALRLFTIGNARAGYEDQDKGSITVGKLGDLAVLSGDPTAMTPKDLFNLKVDATVLGGVVMFQR
jgi:predicted amidohydrolase YtcJ